MAASPLVPYLLVGGYTIDPLALLRILLGLGAIYCYSVFSRRADSFLYQCEVRRAVFVFLTLAAASEFIITALGGVELPALVMARRIGRVGTAFGIFACSSSWRPLRRVSMIVFFSLLMTGMAGLAGTFKVAGLVIHVPALAAIGLMLLASYNYRLHTKTTGLPGLQEVARNLFLLALLTAYVFRFVGVLLGVDLLVFMELAETLALAMGFMAIFSAVKED